ncbi:MAG TPA: RsmE family RNA methyltransferase [Prosthecobacter sp.]|nr:RsmE family RNA methyltransferase [Prosthecobacter sp.]
MSLSRFHLAPNVWREDALVLTGDEAIHCARVQRHQVGDFVEIGDGVGRVAVAEITAITKSEVHLRVEALRRHDPLPYRIHLLPALIKAEPFEWLLEKSVELGAASVRPIFTERTVVHLAGEQMDKKLAKWRRLMIESAKQCHTPFLPELRLPQPLSQALEHTPSDALKVLPALTESIRSVKELLVRPIREVYAMIGPEGDFSPQEELLAREHGFEPVTLGPLVLRAETAAVALLTILGHELRS